MDIKDIATEILIEIRRSPSTYPQAPQTGLETAREMLHDLKNTRVVWEHRREVCLSHNMVQDMTLS